MTPIGCHNELFGLKVISVLGLKDIPLPDAVRTGHYLFFIPFSPYSSLTVNNRAVVTDYCMILVWLCQQNNGRLFPLIRKACTLPELANHLEKGILAVSGIGISI